MIAIIELYQHDEVLRHYGNLLKESDQKITIFCSNAVYQMLGDLRQQSSFEWVVQPKSQSIPVFLKSNYPSIKKAKLVFITTALNNFKAFYQLSTINKTILLIHNTHSFLAPEDFLNLNNGINVMDRLRWLKIQFNRSHYYKKQILKNLTGLIFPTEIVLRYVEDNFNLSPTLKLAALPFAAYEEQAPINPKNHVVVTIPCTVVSEQRDYDLILRSIKKIRNKLSKNVHLILLGKPKGDGQKIIAAFQQIEDPKIKITTFKETIPLEEYNNWLSATDFLILPLKQYGKNHIYKEHLGYSKISGGVNDMIRFGIPALLPNYYPLEKDLEKMIERYTQDLFAEKLLEWINQDKYLSYKSFTNAALNNFSKKKMSSEIRKKIDTIL